MFDVTVTLFFVFLGMVFTIFIARWQIAFQKELRHLTIEIARTEGQEREYWIRKRRRLWLSLLPFVRYSK